MGIQASINPKKSENPKKKIKKFEMASKIALTPADYLIQCGRYNTLRGTVFSETVHGVQFGVIMIRPSSKINRSNSNELFSVYSFHGAVFVTDGAHEQDLGILVAG